ncbi:hypothetical protein [uncultured Apibacter sp.]|uniref:hypothetical protein n=1 Tax=uncultured Apibacter sp. TaxID=1778616 RepID=UPI0025CC4BF0|nr:hypothetical protein [uncultured Apibacter sp.]
MRTTLEIRIDRLKNNGHNISVNKVLTDGFSAWKSTIFYGFFCIIFSYLFNNLVSTILSNYLGTHMIELKFKNLVSQLNNDPRVLEEIISLYKTNPMFINKIILSSFIGILLLYPLNAGVVFCAHQIDKNGRTSFKDLISGYQGKKFIKLLGLQLIHIIIISISCLFLFLPIIYIVPGFILAGAFIIIDDVPLTKAISYSFKIVNMYFGKILLVLIFSYFFSKIFGILMCFIGLLFTLSYSNAIVYSIYRNTVGAIVIDNEVNE